MTRYRLVWSTEVNYLHHVPGGKFSGIKKFFEEYPNLIEIYDYVWTFEDDVLLPYSSLVKARSLLEKYALN